MSENPPMFPPGISSITGITGQWRVAHTKARCEKAFAWDLLRRKIDFFLPLIERTRIYRGRKRKVLIPLFPSYVFFCGSDEDRYKALLTDHLCQTLEVSDQKHFIEELQAIELAILNKASLEIYPQPAIGQRYRITAGALKGLEGVVIQKSKRTRLVLEVKLLGQGAVMEIDSELLEPVE